MSVILIVEPDLQLGQIYTSSIKNRGHDVIWCRSAQSALKSLDEHSIELIVLEIQMAKHNGIEFLYEMRSYNDWQSIPVIIHSQVSPLEPGITRMLKDDLNVNEYCYKPHTKLRDLNQAVDRQLTISV